MKLVCYGIMLLGLLVIAGAIALPVGLHWDPLYFVCAGTPVGIAITIFGLIQLQKLESRRH